MKLPKLPKVRRSAPGRHRAGEGRPSRTVTPEPARYTGRRRSRTAAPPPPPAPAPAERPTARVRRPVARKLTPLDNRPYEVNAPKSPRERFRGGDGVAARIDYERRQRDELRAQRAAGGGKMDARSKDARRRGDMGQRVPARSRFAGESSSAERNATARKLPTHGPARAVGTAGRQPSAIPSHPSKKQPGLGQLGRHRGDPEPGNTGKTFAGEGHPYFRKR